MIIVSALRVPPRPALSHRLWALQAWRIGWKHPSKHIFGGPETRSGGSRSLVGCSWDGLGLSWGALGILLGLLGSLLQSLGYSWGALGTSWCPRESLLVCPGHALGSFLGLLAPLGSSLGPLGCFYAFGNLLGASSGRPGKPKWVEIRLECARMPFCLETRNHPQRRTQ